MFFGDEPVWDNDVDVLVLHVKLVCELLDVEIVFPVLRSFRVVAGRSFCTGSSNRLVTK